MAGLRNYTKTEIRTAQQINTTLYSRVVCKHTQKTRNKIQNANATRPLETLRAATNIYAGPNSRKSLPEGLLNPFRVPNPEAREEDGAPRKLFTSAPQGKAGRKKEKEERKKERKEEKEERQKIKKEKGESKEQKESEKGRK